MRTKAFSIPDHHDMNPCRSLNANLVLTLALNERMRVLRICCSICYHHRDFQYLACLTQVAAFPREVISLETAAYVVGEYVLIKSEILPCEGSHEFNTLLQRNGLNSTSLLEPHFTSLMDKSETCVFTLASRFFFFLQLFLDLEDLLFLETCSLV